MSADTVERKALGRKGGAAELFRKYQSVGSEGREDIINEIVRSNPPRAASCLVKIVENEEDHQLRGNAIFGFLVIHPKAIRDDLIRLAGSKMLEGDGEPDMMRSVLVRAVGLMDDLGNIGVLKALERRIKAVPARYYSDSLEFNFLASYARLGDSEAARKLTERMLKLRAGELLEALRAIGYCRNLAVAEGLTRLFNNDQTGSRTGPWIDYAGPPKSDEEAEIRRKREENAYVRVKDDALYAIAQILKGVRNGGDIGFDPEPKRRYSESEFGLVRRKIDSMKGRH